MTKKFFGLAVINILNTGTGGTNVGSGGSVGGGAGNGAGISPGAGGGSFAGPTGVSGLPSPITGISQVQSLVCVIIDWLFWGLIVLAIVMFLVSAYKYVTSGGEPERTRSANRTLLYAAIAVVVALLAGGLPLIIGSFFQVSSVGACGGFGGLL